MFIAVVNEESKNHSYGDPDIEVAKVALRTFIKHHPSDMQARIQIAEYEFRFRRVDEITKYDNETYSYKTFSASACVGADPILTTWSIFDRRQHGRFLQIVSVEIIPLIMPAVEVIEIFKEIYSDRLRSVRSTIPSGEAE